jgi:hypothetical protein
MSQRRVAEESALVPCSRNLRRVNSLEVFLLPNSAKFNVELDLRSAIDFGANLIHRDRFHLSITQGGDSAHITLDRGQSQQLLNEIRAALEMAAP